MVRFLVGIDGSPPSQRALEHATRQVANKGDHEIVLLTVIPPALRESGIGRLMPAGLALPEQMDRTFEQSARLRLDEIAEELKASGVKVRAEVRAGATVDEIIRAAQEFGVVEIVLGNKAFEPHHVEIGRNAAAIAERANVRVTLVP